MSVKNKSSMIARKALVIDFFIIFFLIWKGKILNVDDNLEKKRDLKSKKNHEEKQMLAIEKEITPNLESCQCSPKVILSFSSALLFCCI